MHKFHLIVSLSVNLFSALQWNREKIFKSLKHNMEKAFSISEWYF